METVAVYSEPIIRTYGFDLREGLHLFELVVPDPCTAGRDPVWRQLFERECRFEWMAVHGGPQAAPVLWLACDDANARIVRAALDAGTSPDPNVDLKPLQRVDGVHFHGPHFGDRWGIADQTLAAVSGPDLGLLAMTCSISGIYLLFVQGRGRPARDKLATVFEIPQKCAPPAFLPGRPSGESP